MTNPQTDSLMEPETTAVADPEPQTEPTKKPKKKRALRVILIILLVLLLLLSLAGGMVAWMYRQGQQDLLVPETPVISPPEEILDSNEGDRVVYQGISYRYNENVTAVLVVGVDKTDIQEDTAYGQNGQADTLFLATLDTVTGDVHIIPLSRETMVEVDQYAVDGSYIGVKETQLCLAYAYASNGEEGCENVVRSVSRLLYGAPINSYIAIDLEGVEALTDVVGGVPLTALEDVPHPRKKDTFIVREGQKITLNGKDALTYLRHRDTDMYANNRRMQRLRQFFTAFIAQAGGKLKNNIGLLPRYYNTVKPYTVTDLSLSKITYLAGCTLSGSNWNNPEYHTILGRSEAGEKHAEFYADTDSAYKAVLEAFYINEGPVNTTSSTEATSSTDSTAAPTQPTEE